MKKRYTKTRIPITDDPSETGREMGERAGQPDPGRRGAGAPDAESVASGADAAEKDDGMEGVSIPSAHSAGERTSADAVFRDIVAKAREGDIKYQELYLRYIDLISGKMGDGDEVIYEAAFVDDKDKGA